MRMFVMKNQLCIGVNCTNTVTQLLQFSCIHPLGVVTVAASQRCVHLDHNAPELRISHQRKHLYDIRVHQQSSR